GWCESDEQSHRTGYAYSPEGQLIPGTLLGKGIPKIDLGNNADSLPTPRLQKFTIPSELPQGE
ncbi:hypothetical protein, partial [Shewanella oncorhynchi]